MKSEHMMHIANFHWYIFVPGLLLYLISIALFIVNDLLWFIFGMYVLGLAFLFLLIPIIVNITKELTITSKHIIFKTGLISRQTIKLNHSTINSLQVKQNIFGRIFGFGTIIFNVTGGEKTEISGICKPLEFEKDARTTIDANHV
jgi:uncharacterized membrane protein YdbT with pleckstrin-like domain